MNTRPPSRPSFHPLNTEAVLFTLKNLNFLPQLAFDNIPISFVDNHKQAVEQKSVENNVIFVSTYNPNNPELFQVIKQNFDILPENELMNGILSNYNIVKIKRQPQSQKNTNKSQIRK